MPDADKETPEIRAVLFDKDGTLVDYYAMWGPAYRAAADDLAVAAGDPALASCLLRMGGYDPDSGPSPQQLLDMF